MKQPPGQHFGAEKSYPSSRSWREVPSPLSPSIVCPFPVAVSLLCVDWYAIIPPSSVLPPFPVECMDPRHCALPACPRRGKLCAAGSALLLCRLLPGGQRYCVGRLLIFCCLVRLLDHHLQWRGDDDGRMYVQVETDKLTFMHVHIFVCVCVYVCLSVSAHPPMPLCTCRGGELQTPLGKRSCGILQSSHSPTLKAPSCGWSPIRFAFSCCSDCTPLQL